MPTDLIGSHEAATILGVDKSTISRWVAHGHLHVALRLPHANSPMLFKRSDIARLAKRRQKAAS